ncbi:tail assembly chaperone [Yersinia phage vB_YenM_P778]
MAKTAKKVIGDKTVNIILLGTLDGLKMSTKLSKIAMPTVSKLFDTTDKKKKINLVEVLPELIGMVDELELGDMVSKLFENATVNDFPLQVDSYFSGNYGELIDFLAFALEANFKSFFDASFFKNQN